MGDQERDHGDEEERLDPEESGIFTWDLQTNILQGDTAVSRLFGLKPSDVLAGLPIENFLARIHKSDRPKVAESIHYAIVSGGPYHEVYTVDSNEGAVDVVAFGRCFRDAEGNPSQYAGIVIRANETGTGDPVVSHIATAHKLAVARHQTQVADALEAILEDLAAETSCLRSRTH